MIVIEYLPTGGNFFPDGVLLEEAERLWKIVKQYDDPVEDKGKANWMARIVISQEALLMAFRVLILRGVIPHNRICLKIGDKKYARFDKYGYPEKYLNGFESPSIKFSTELLRCLRKKREQESNQQN